MLVIEAVETPQELRRRQPELKKNGSSGRTRTCGETANKELNRAQFGKLKHGKSMLDNELISEISLS